MPSFCDIDFGLLFANGNNYLIGCFLDRHNPKQTFSLCHGCVNKTWPDVCYGYTTTVLESLFPNCFHIIYLVSFSCTIGGCCWFASQSANRTYCYKMTKTLLLKNAIQFINNISPTYNISIYCRTLNCIVKCGINVTNACTHDDKIKVC